MEIIRLENACLYGENRGNIENLNMSVEAGQIWGILGAAGAGKTALCRLLSGREEPDDGQRIRCAPESGRRSVAYVPAKLRLRTGMRCRSLLAALGNVSGHRADYSWILEQCSRFGLRPEARVSRMEPGEQKRLALISALQCPCDLLVLDEPSLLLEYHHRSRFFSLLRNLQEEGTAVVFTTRSVEEVRCFATHALILDGGRALAQGPLETLECLNAVGVTLQPAEGSVAECMAELGVTNFTDIQGTARFFYHGSADELIGALSHRSVARLEIREPDLESVMKVCRTGGRTRDFTRVY